MRRPYEAVRTANVRSVFASGLADPELWAHFGSAEAVNDALRRVVSERKKAAGS
jgi:hypothetical protein